MDEFRVSGAMRFEQLQQVLNANAAQRRENIQVITPPPGSDPQTGAVQPRFLVIAKRARRPGG